MWRLVIPTWYYLFWALFGGEEGRQAERKEEGERRCGLTCTSLHNSFTWTQWQEPHCTNNAYVLVHQTRQREKQTWSVAKKDHTNPNPRKMGGEGKSVKCSTVEPEQRIIKFPLRSLNYSHRRPFDGASCSLKQ